MVPRGDSNGYKSAPDGGSGCLSDRHMGGAGTLRILLVGHTHSAVHSELFPADDDTDDPDLDPDRDDAGNVGSEGPPYQNCSTEEL
jgi:hypothetical protein